MILLDTNIISEMMKPSPEINVINWIDQQSITQLFVTTISIAEISYDINALAKGKRRQSLEEAFNYTMHEAFKHRIITLNENSAYLYGELMAKRKLLGKPLSILDGQIAAIALSHQAVLATRNIRDFSHCDLKLINPFQ